MIFRSLRKTGRLDLEAVEMATRAAVHRAGAALLSELLRAEQPAAEVNNVIFRLINRALPAKAV